MYIYDLLAEFEDDAFLAAYADDLAIASSSRNKKKGLRKKDALCRSEWSVGVNKIAAGLR